MIQAWYVNDARHIFSVEAVKLVCCEGASLRTCSIGVDTPELILLLFYQGDAIGSQSYAADYICGKVSSWENDWLYSQLHSLMCFTAFLFSHWSAVFATNLYHL